MRESDFEQPLLDDGKGSNYRSYCTAQNGHAWSEVLEAAYSVLEAAALGTTGLSMWQDPLRDV